MPRASVLLTVPIIVVFIGLYSYSSYYLFTELHQLWDYSWPVVTGFIVWSYIVFNKFAKENALKKQIAKQEIIKPIAVLLTPKDAAKIGIAGIIKPKPTATKNETVEINPSTKISKLLS